MAQQQAKKKKKLYNCTYDSLYGFLKQASVWVVGAVWKKNTAIFKSTPVLIMLNQSLNDLRLNQKWSLWCKPKVTPGTRQAGPHYSLCLIDWVHKTSYLKALSVDIVGKVWPPHIQNGGPNPRGGQVSHRFWSINLPRRRIGKGSSCGWCETHAPPP